MNNLSHEAYIKYYETLQQDGYGSSPIDAGRAIEIWSWITTNYPSPLGVKVLDCSCGRGYLLKMLDSEGFDAEGTEASAWLIENVLKDKEYPVRALYYSQLGELPSAEWDVVVSNDVLEHLFCEDEMRTALTQLARIAKKWLCISVGLERATHIIGGNGVMFHHLVRPPEWWIAEVAKVATVREQYRYHLSQMIFAEV